MILKFYCFLLYLNAIHYTESKLNQTKVNENLLALLERTNRFWSHYKKTYARNCAEATASSHSSGVYEIHVPNYIRNTFKVACAAATHEGGWSIILNRMDGNLSFNQNISTYEKGFGDLDGEFFLGLDKIHALTADGNQKLLVILEDLKGNKATSMYENFAIGDKDEGYALHKRTAKDFLPSWGRHREPLWWLDAYFYVNSATTQNATNASGSYFYIFRDPFLLKRATMMLRARITSN